MNTITELNKGTVDIDVHIQAIIQTSIDGVICIDSNNTIIEFNRACEQMLRMVKAEVIGRTFTDVIIPERYKKAHELRVLQTQAKDSLFSGQIGGIRIFV